MLTRSAASITPSGPVGKAQAMNTIHPALHDVAFEQDGPRVGAYTSWAGHAPPPREKP